MISERQLFLKHLAQTSEIPLMLEIDSANGIFIYDKSGKKYIDLISGIAVSSLGHNNKRIIESIKLQLDKHMHTMVYGEFIQSIQVQLATALCELLPTKLNSVYLVNSGTEANEGAVKLAKRYTSRPHVVSFKNAYHGSTHGSLSLMGDETFKNSFRPLLPGVQFCNFNDESSLGIIDGNTAAVIVEPIQAEAGIIVPTGNFLTKLRDKCNQTGSLLIFDEIQTGFGRTGKLFGFEHFNVVPDIVTFAKAFGGGMPLGAFVSSKEIMHSLTHQPVLGHITTFGGHPVSCAAAFESLKIITEDDLSGHAKKCEEIFRNILVHPRIKELRGRGLFLAMQLESFDEVRKVILSSLEQGVIADWFLFCRNAIRIAPPLLISEDEIIRSSEILKKALNKI